MIDPAVIVQASLEAAFKGLIQVLEDVASDYGCNGDHDSMIVANAFDRLSDKLKAKLLP